MHFYFKISTSVPFSISKSKMGQNSSNLCCQGGYTKLNAGLCKLQELVRMRAKFTNGGV